jgi:hypothetical protein
MELKHCSINIYRGLAPPRAGGRGRSYRWRDEDPLQGNSARWLPSLGAATSRDILGETWACHVSFELWRDYVKKIRNIIKWKEWLLFNGLKVQRSFAICELTTNISYSMCVCVCLSNKWWRTLPVSKYTNRLANGCPFSNVRTWKYSQHTCIVPQELIPNISMHLITN